MAVDRVVTEVRLTTDKVPYERRAIGVQHPDPIADTSGVVRHAPSSRPPGCRATLDRRRRSLQCSRGDPFNSMRRPIVSSPPWGHNGSLRVVGGGNRPADAEDGGCPCDRHRVGRGHPSGILPHPHIPSSAGARTSRSDSTTPGGCLRATDKAIYILIPAVPGRRAEWRGWIPQSQIHDDSEVWRAGDTGRLVLTRWIARQKGFVFGPG